MTMHSKGPWRQCAAQPDGIITDDPTGLGCRTPECAASCLEYYGGYLVAESIAPHNRALISAAPDLLNALVALLEGIQFLIDEYPSEAQEERDAARAAIAKAMGEEVR